MFEFLNKYLIEIITIAAAAVSFVAVTKYKGANTDDKIDHLSNRMDGFQNTLQSIQLENAKTGERVLNIQDQLKEIKHKNEKNN